MRASTIALLLLALPCLASSQLMTDDEINGIAALCDVSASNPDAHALLAGACRTCVTTLTSATSTIEESGRAYACHGVCQNNDVIDQLVASDGTVITFSSPDATQRANLCVGCLSRANVTAYGCQHCLETNAAAADVTSCMDCLELNPWAGSTDPAKSYLINSYQWACGQCQSIPAGAARDQCMACIASPTAQALYPGILTAGELASPGAITTDPTPTARDNDFGRCVYFANQTYLINSGSTEITGIYDSCKSGLDTSSKLQCMQCMFAAEQGDLNLANTSYNLQASPSKDWACAAYCQNPAYQPSTITKLTSQSSKCEACIQDADVTDAWACGNCLQVSLVAGATTDMVDDCFTNVKDDPYLGYASNYNWAVGKCASIVDSDLRTLCMTCVRSQELPDITDGLITLSKAFNQTTEANICGCVDLIQNQTVIDANLTRYGNQLDAIQRACFAKQVYYDEHDKLVEPAIPWGTTPFTVASDGSTAYPCLECIAIATNKTAPGGNNKAYACTEYCQDPRLVTSADQGDACSTCVKHPVVADPSGCKLCMEATSNDTKRADCFSCVQSAFNGASNKAWGCSQCAQFANDTVASDCYKCLELPGSDPCTCVDLSKNGTVHEFLGPQTDCVPLWLRVWIWIGAGDSIAYLPWSVDTESYENGVPASHVASGNASQADASFVTLIPSNSIAIFAVNLPITTGASFAGQPSLWLNLYHAAATVEPGAIAWDWSQGPTGLPQGYFNSSDSTWVDSTNAGKGLAFKLFDSCGKTLIDTITQAAFIDVNAPSSLPENQSDFAYISDEFTEGASQQLVCPDSTYAGASPPICISP